MHVAKLFAILTKVIKHLFRYYLFKHSLPVRTNKIKTCQEIYAKAILWLLSRSGGKFRTYYKVKGLTTLDSSVI